MRLPSLHQRRLIQRGFLASLIAFALFFSSALVPLIPAQAASTPAVGMARTLDNGGYWIVTQDGAVYAFGNASYLGGANTFAHAAPIVSMAATTTNGGYWLAASDGAVYGFGDAQYKGGANT